MWVQMLVTMFTQFQRVPSMQPEATPGITIPSILCQERVWCFVLYCCDHPPQVQKQISKTIIFLLRSEPPLRDLDEAGSFLGLCTRVQGRGGHVHKDMLFVIRGAFCVVRGQTRITLGRRLNHFHYDLQMWTLG